MWTEQLQRKTLKLIRADYITNVNNMDPLGMTEWSGIRPSGICTTWPPVTMVTWVRRGHTEKCSNKSEMQTNLKEWITALCLCTVRCSWAVIHSEGPEGHLSRSNICMKPRQPAEDGPAERSLGERRGLVREGYQGVQREKAQLVASGRKRNAVFWSETYCLLSPHQQDTETLKREQ